MQLTHLALLLSLVLAPSFTQKLTPNAVTSLLQGILTPRNSEQVIQVLSAAANKKRALSNVPGTVNRRFAIADNVPRTIVRNEAPSRIAQLVQTPQKMCMKKNVVVQNSNNVMLQNGQQMVLPKNMVVQRRKEVVLPKNVIMQNDGAVTAPRNVIVRKNEVPKIMVVQNKDFLLQVPQMRAPEVQKKVLVKQQRRPEVQQVLIQPQMTEYVNVPRQNVLVNKPLLPAASPISPLTALSSSSALPLAMPQSRGQFLRKIPIPPPTL